MSAFTIVLLIGYVFSLFDAPKRQAPFKYRSEWDKVHIPFFIKVILVIEAMIIMSTPYWVVLELLMKYELMDYLTLGMLFSCVIFVVSLNRINKATKRELKINELLEKEYGEDV